MLRFPLPLHTSSGNPCSLDKECRHYQRFTHGELGSKIEPDYFTCYPEDRSSLMSLLQVLEAFAKGSDQGTPGMNKTHLRVLFK